MDEENIKFKINSKEEEERRNLMMFTKIAFVSFVIFYLLTIGSIFSLSKTSKNFLDDDLGEQMKEGKKWVEKIAELNGTTLDENSNLLELNSEIKLKMLELLLERRKERKKNNNNNGDTKGSNEDEEEEDEGNSENFLYNGDFLRRVILKNTSVTCNDGTTAGYYIRKSNSNRWIIFLEGGWHCFSTITCYQRWLRMRHLMTSAHWPEVRVVKGILSSDPSENPYWWNANHVLIPYCSSDSWSGDSPGKQPGDLSFLGSRIIDQVIFELLPLGLYNSKMLLLAGSSAGAAGVLVNLDRISDLLFQLGSKVEVRGLADSGWFLDNQPFDFNTVNSNSYDEHQSSSSTPSSTPKSSDKISSCIDPHNCAPIDGIKQGIKLWNGQVPIRCRNQYESEPWRCYFGYRIYSTLRTPLFVFQWLFDEAQMTVDNVGAPVTKAQWNYIHKMGQELKKTLENVTAVFAPSCISHVVLTKRDWTKIKVNGISLPQALRCWELQSSEHNHHDFDLIFNPVLSVSKEKKNKERKNSGDKENKSNETCIQPHETSLNKLFKILSTSFASTSPHTHLTSPSSIHTNIRFVEKIRKKKKRRKHKRRHQQQQLNNLNRGVNKNLKNVKLKEKRKELTQEKMFNHERHRWLMHEDLCHHWALDSCSWPQCNRRCPKLHNPFTGEEVDFINLLKSFGLDMSSVANSLGIDLTTLNEMDHDTLLQLLTQ